VIGIIRKPALGPAPAAIRAPTTRYSPAATAVAGVFVTFSRDGKFADPQLTVSAIAGQTGLSEDDVKDALHELGHHILAKHALVLPKDTLYAEFDRYWQPWDPAKDSLKLAADMLNDAKFPIFPKDIADRYEWPPRRLNPAITYPQTDYL